MFIINVTTDRDVYDAAGVSNCGIARFDDGEGRSSSPVNAFGTTSYAQMYRIRSPTHPCNGYTLGIRTAHEFGHLVGLGHDGGQPGGEYWDGNPTHKWVPYESNFWKAVPW